MSTLKIFVAPFDLGSARAGASDGAELMERIQQAMELDRGLGFAKRCPVEQTQTQIDGHEGLRCYSNTRQPLGASRVYPFII